MNRKMMRLFIIGLLIVSIIIMTGCAEEATTEDTTTPPEETSPEGTTVPPVAQISETPDTVNFGESVTFSGAASSDSDGNITSYNWDFGDGNTASGETVTHTYDGTGDYRVELTVSDDDGLSDTAWVSVKVVLDSIIKIEATASTWREGEQPYDIYSAIKRKLETVGFDVVPQESSTYDYILLVDYKEAKGDPYSPSGYGTDITCNLTLRDKAQHRIFEKEIFATTSTLVIMGDLYSSAVSNFKSKLYFKYLGKIIASRLGVGDEVPVLISALEDSHCDVREEAAEVLGEIGDARAVEPLIQALQDENDDVREKTAEALGEIGDARAVEPLIQALQDENDDVREKAAEALGEIGDARAIEPLIQALEDSDYYVRIAAEEALKKIRGY